MTVITRSDIIKRWIGTADPFEKVKGINGLIVRSKEGRTTQRFELEHRGFYAKLHEGIGWSEVIKNLLQLRLPITGASNEWLAINRLRELGVDTLNAIGYGTKGNNPARKTSYLITEELTDTISLAVYAQKWPEMAPDFLRKKSLLEKVAQIASVIHHNGINHRDLYLCHFLLDQSEGAQRDSTLPDSTLPYSNVRLFLVDLHRAQIRPSVPRRWLVKDLASIYFSAMDIGLTRRDVYRFLKAYYQRPLRDILGSKKQLLLSVRSRAVKLYRRDFNRDPAEPF